MNMISSFTIIILRTKEKLGFKLSEKEDLLILIDDANKVASMILRMERVKDKMKMRIEPSVEHVSDVEHKQGVEHEPDIEHDEYVKLSPVSSSKAKIKLDQSDENINLYIR